MSLVTRENRGDIAILTLNRGDRLNAINEAMVGELEKQLDAISQDGTRGMILTGTGRAFSVGTDLKEPHTDNSAWLQRIHRLMLRLHEFPRPVVAAVNGLALGGGLEFAVACHFRVASATAELGLPEVKLGLLPMYGGTQFVSRLVGINRALELTLNGDPVSAHRALAMGLVNKVAEDSADLLDTALDYVRGFSRHSAAAHAAIRRAIEGGAHLPLAEALQLEARIAAATSQSQDALEGVTAFLEKRKPVWKDR